MPRNNKPRKSGQRPKPWSTKPEPAGGRAARRQRSQRRARDGRISVRAELRRQPDVNQIARVVVALAMAQAEADAKRQQDHAAPDEAAEVETPDA